MNRLSFIYRKTRLLQSSLSIAHKSLSSSSSSSSSTTTATTITSVPLSITSSCYKDKSTLELILISSLFKLCSYDSLVSLISRILLDKTNKANSLMTFAIRHTCFKYFCGGIDYVSCEESINSYYKNYNITTIIDHSTEELELEEYSHQNLIQKIHLITTISNNNNNAIRYIPIKCTALLNPTILEKLTTIIINDNNNDIIDKLNDEEKILFDNGIKRFYTLCKLAKSKNISLLLDAEQSNRQPAIEYVYNILARKYNQKGPVIYNTYQLYLNRTLGALDKDIELAQKLGYHFAAKIVRGAYMKTESKRIPNPVIRSKDQVDSNYNDAVRRCLKIVQQQDSSFLFATHNRQSIQTIIDTMQEYSIEKDSSSVSFAQIKGMSDHLSNALGLAGYNCSKLILYGEFEQLLPWLIRRLDENNILSSMHNERVHYHQEIFRRLKIYD